jgi:hypothetical protein
MPFPIIAGLMSKNLPGIATIAGMENFVRVVADPTIISPMENCMNHFIVFAITRKV